MNCIRCESKRILTINAKSSDLNTHFIEHLDHEHDGHNPEIPGVCDGDYINLTFCLDCGQIQDFKSLDDDELKSIYKIDIDEVYEDESDREYEEMIARKYTKDVFK